MSKPNKKASWRHRPLLTETLPYELPVIFGNEKFYFRKCRHPDNDISSFVSNLMKAPKLPTIPYNYAIRKDGTRTTELSIVHPLVQIEFCELYARYENSLLDFCSRSPFSLRYPAAIAAVYARSVDSDEVVHKAGQVDIRSGDFDVELSKLVSYFAYERYRLLNKFYDSREFIRLEKRFEFLRQLDISKCFYGIYTHSISWATRGKAYAKDGVGSHYFEGHFDALMQRSNYGETNGIVVGPEFSRIFAEIILQGVDREVAKRLWQDHKLAEGRDYAVRRYVDDYCVFASAVETISMVENELRTELAKFKLHLNESKIQEFQRPFVSQLSHARSELRRMTGALKAVFAADTWKSPQDLPADLKVQLNALVTSLRTTVHLHKIEVAHISGSLMADLRTAARQATAPAKQADPVWGKKWAMAISRILDCAFYVSALDLRVRTTYSLCQLLSAVSSAKQFVSAEVWHDVEQTALDEMVTLSRLAFQSSKKQPRGESVELYNVLVCGCHILGNSYLRAAEIETIFDDMLRGPVTYFKFICLKYCLLRDSTYFSARLDTLNKNAEDIGFSAESIARDSERFHLFCDLLGSPDLSPARKRSLYVKAFGGNPSAALISKLGEWIGFADWSGMSIEHTLKRRQMRPVYAVA